MKSKVASFAVDHTTLDRGFYLRSLYTVARIYPIKSYDMRFRAPREKSYLTPEAIHTIEHLMAHYLREKLGNKVVSFAPEGETVESVRFEGDYAYVCTAKVVKVLHNE